MHPFYKSILLSFVYFGSCLFTEIVAQSGPEVFYSEIIGESATGTASFSCETNQFLLTSGSANVSGKDDSFQYIYKSLAGDVDVKAHISNNNTALTGLMIRSGGTSNAPFAFAGLSGGKTITRYRSVANEAASDVSSVVGATWLRISRVGDSISSYSSSDGSSWSLLETTEAVLGQLVLVGMVGVNGSSTFSEVIVEGELSSNIEVVGPIGPNPTDPDPTEPNVLPSDSADESFNAKEIGTKDLRSSASYDVQNDIFRMSAVGGETWGQKDDFYFINREVAGDVEVTVKINSLVTGDEFGKAGIMFRESASEDSMHAFLTVSGGKGVDLSRRHSEGGGTTRSGKGGIVAPVWLRLIKEGTYISAYYSEDGENWSFLSEDIVDFSDTIFIGLAVAANGKDDMVTADFTQLNILKLEAQSSTETFISTDIGKVGVNGDAAYDSLANSFIVAAAGGDIGSTRDAFHYVFREVSGDFETITRIDSLVAEQNLAKAGLMVRDGLRPDAPYFAIFMAQNVGVMYQSRSVFGGNSNTSEIGNIGTPFWVKITRTGNLYQAHYSMDGTHWTFVNETSMSLSEILLVGMAVTSHQEGALAFGEFSNLSVND
ncbi:MAG: hypothetical protein O3C43_19560 [Verrucomicrobia bacterium]|nr:hypothetical protein [Verrucomicrobiota bacterium]MDA1068689.1 hypothetical protein [Verrucomicrobiota bacterium]